MPDVSYGSLPFSEQLAFFRRKLNLPTNAWTDIQEEQHDWAFVVAGANRDDVLTGFRKAVDKLIADGSTLEDFRRDFDRIVAETGWDYKGGRNWRSRVIYENNLNSSYASGRYAQLQAVTADFPYWRYIHSDAVQHPREHHLAWHGITLRADDPWWRTHFGPNGWGCQCGVQAVSDGMLKREGKSGPDKAPPLNMQTKLIGARGENPREVQVPEGIDPGWAYTPGRARYASAVPPERGSPAGGGTVGTYGLPNRRAPDLLPAPRDFPKSRLLSGAGKLSEEDYANAFLKEFGATLEEPAVFTDVMGSRLVMGEGLFLDKKSQTLKANKQGRGPYMRMLADAIKSPDEIWARLEWNSVLKVAQVRRRYLARFNVEGEPVPGMAVFEVADDGWWGVTTFSPESVSALEQQRIGVRIYKRPE